MDMREAPTRPRPDEAAARNPGWSFSMEDDGTWKAACTVLQVLPFAGARLRIVIDDAQSLESCETRVRIARRYMERHAIIPQALRAT